MKKVASMIMGLIIIFVGSVFLLRTLGIAEISIWDGFLTFWPVGIMLVGLALIFRKRSIAFVILAVTIAILILYGIGSIGTGVERTVVQEISLADVDTMELSIDYGAGDFEITKGDGEYLVVNTVKTTDEKDPLIEKDIDGSVAEISLSRQAMTGFLFNQQSDWDIELSPDVLIDLKLDYGAAQGIIDLRGLQVANLEISSGACQTDIIFGDYPTKVSIETGATELNLQFPEGAAARVEIDGSALGIDMDEFNEVGRKTYESKDYDGTGIDVTIEAGAASINAEWY